MIRQTQTTTRSNDMSRGKRPRVGSWDDAIADFRQRIRDLRQAIRVFQEQKKRGESWAGHKSEQQHSLEQKAQRTAV